MHMCVLHTTSSKKIRQCLSGAYSFLAGFSKIVFDQKDVAHVARLILFFHANSGLLGVPFMH